MRCLSRLRVLPVSLLAATALAAPLLAATGPSVAAVAAGPVQSVSGVGSDFVLAEAEPAVVSRSARWSIAGRSSGRSYAFSGRQADGSAIRWNPCAAIPWVFNPAQAPVGGLQAVSSALQRVSLATGLRFHYAGKSAEVPATSYLQSQTAGAPRPLLIGWTTGTQSSLLANRIANVGGVTQPLWARQASGRTSIVSGVIALNAKVSVPLTGARSWRTLLLHEIGHAAGLSHVADSRQIMNAVIPAQLTDYAAGDRSGLRRVGAASGCLS